MNRKIILLGLISLLLFGCNCSNEIINKKDERISTDNVHNCYMCGSSDVYVNQYKNGYWLECEQCHLRSGNYTDKDELIELWNNINQ